MITVSAVSSVPICSEVESRSEPGLMQETKDHVPNQTFNNVWYGIFTFLLTVSIGVMHYFGN